MFVDAGTDTDTDTDTHPMDTHPNAGTDTDTDTDTHPMACAMCVMHSCELQNLYAHRSTCIYK